MLILTRKQDEMISIGEDIKINVCAIEGGQVRIGIIAPANVTIYRQEVLDRILKERDGTG